MLMDKGSALQLEPTNVLQPEEFCPSGLLTSVAQPSTAAAEAQNKDEPRQIGSNEINGRWLLSTGDVLVIDKETWTHPSKGQANLARDGDDKLIVRYPQLTGAKCSYRIVMLENGKALQLVPMNNLQPEEYCPIGRLTVLP
jgi:hypothetical protein